MAIAWYGVKAWLLTSPDKSERIIATLTAEDGTVLAPSVELMRPFKDVM